MKAILFALCATLAVTTARVVINSEGQETPHLLGSKACTWGPSYWCQDLKSAAGCNATKHCISKVWESMTVPEDKDDVCGICKDMVQQARDQLESNETQEDLKLVFEGSCALIHIKPIVEECDKLVDQFIPELVETLASQMNPSVVCSVAGLCNSAHIDKLLLEYHNTMKEVDEIKPKSLANDELEPDECSKCYTIATHMQDKFTHTSRDNILERMLHVCGRMDSYSDACSSIILTYFNDIYAHLQENFNAANICHLSGQCSAKFHKHENDDDKKPLEVEIRPLSSVGMVEVSDDLPCKLCVQLVSHLRDLLVANTTMNEFQIVLEGLCKQTRSFATECKAIVDEYYKEIYVYLTMGLNGNAVCEMASICPAPGNSALNGPIWPLIHEKPAQIGLEIMNKKKQNLGENGAGIRNVHKNTEAEEMQLPLERFYVPFGNLGLPQTGAQGKQTCALCEYFLHYVQEAITDPVTESKVKNIIGEICEKLPKSVHGECQQFVDTYGDAVVAILAQEIDPSQVCPMIHVCPSQSFLEAWETIPKEMVLESDVKDKPSCPLCLLAVTQLYNVIKDNKTENSIRNALSKLCIHLPNDLSEECKDLVKIYSDELIELLIADLTPQEVCVYIKLCDPSKNTGVSDDLPNELVPTNFFPLDNDGEIMTNEIPDFPLHPVPHKKVADDTKCVVCEFVMQYIEKSLKNKKNKDEIEKVVHGVCNYLPKTIANECNDFVTEYADIVIDLLSQEVEPKEVCTMIGLCQADMQKIQESVAECALCQAIISAIDKLLANPTIDNDIEQAVAKVCKYLPASKQSKCTMLMEVYEQSIINILRSYGDTKKICSKLALCSASDYLAMSHLNPRKRRSYSYGQKPCTWGKSYLCSTDEVAAECNVVDYCKEKVWKAESASAANQKIAV
ncbi:prosaposin [Cephus cinctus]|uniref:Prosaposin n=1 Tax=Cephus cinctus TaxID=211228 RepID=A0AAJ7BP02_CEPCN|nr:prosaposin [Cephus cinctus]